MDMPEGTADIETSIDRLLSYVRAKGRSDLYNAAQAIGMPAPKVENIAGMLEQSGLLEVRYSLTGIELIAKETQATATAKEEVEKRVSKLHEEEAMLEREVKESERVVDFVEEDLLKRIRSAEAALTAIEGVGQFSEEDLARLGREIDTLRLEVDTIRAKTRQVERSETDLMDRLSAFSQKLNALKAREVMLTITHTRNGWFKRAVSGFLGGILSVFRRKRPKPTEGTRP